MSEIQNKITSLMLKNAQLKQEIKLLKEENKELYKIVNDVLKAGTELSEKVSKINNELVEIIK